MLHLKDVSGVGVGAPVPDVHHVGGSYAPRGAVGDVLGKATGAYQGRDEPTMPEHSVVKIIVDVTAEIKPLCDELSTFQHCSKVDDWFNDIIPTDLLSCCYLC
jgi:hypothetical protein